jgi:putative ABC transport system ATP-binding protein
LWRGGQTIVLVTHDPELAEFTSRVLVMRDGKLVSDKRQTPRLVAAEVAA